MKFFTLLFFFLATSLSLNAQNALKYSTFNKLATTSMAEVDDWLKQFTLNCENTYRIIINPNDEIYGWREIQHSYYKEGIVYTQTREHEGASYELYVPLLSIAHVKKNIDRLCRNMGGCIPPEEMEISYEIHEFGVMVSWGGGC